MKREDGFTLFELLITMAIMVIIMGVGTDMFVGLLRGFKQQSRITQSNIEGIIGLEMLRRDIDSAGFGLPWGPSPMTYLEASAAGPALYNDANGAASAPPRPILVGNYITDSGYVSGSDCLVIKATSIGNNTASTKWTYLLSTGTPTWTTESENLRATDRIIVVNPGTGSGTANLRTLITTTFSSDVTYADRNSFAPADAFNSFIVYGVDGDTNLRMPFNRADYYVSKTVTIPQRCAPGSGVLVKSTINHSDGERNTLPLLDCVRDMQVTINRDTDTNGVADTISDGDVLSPLTAAQIRAQLKEVYVFILTHEGGKDTSYTYPGSSIVVVGQSAANGREFDLTTVADWRNYRWRLHTLVLNPRNLR